MAPVPSSSMQGGEGEEVDRRLVVVADGTGDQALLRRYWAGSIDDSGKPVFSESVAAIAEDLGVQPGEVARLVRATGFAQRLDWTCPSCGQLWKLRIRSEQRPRGPRARCEDCTAAEQELVRESEEARAALDVRRRQTVEESYGRGDTEADAAAVLPGLDKVAFADLAAFYTWLLYSGPDGILVPAKSHDHVLFASIGTEGRLESARLVGIDPSSSPDAFVWLADGHEYTGRYFPSIARFHVPGSGPLGDRVKLAIDSVESALLDAWPSEWVEASIGTVKALLSYEAARYLSHQLARHTLAPLSADQWTKLTEHAEDALDTYSLGQCYSMLWRSAKDGAALTKRSSAGPVGGTGHAVNQFGANIARARSSDWEVHEYVQPTDLRFALETSVVCERIFAMEPMTLRIDDVRAVAGNRLSDEETVARLIAEGLPKPRAAAALRRLADLPPYGDGVDPLIDALVVAAAAVLKRGGTESDAVRTMYFSLEALRACGSFSDLEIEEAEITIRDAISGGAET